VWKRCLCKVVCTVAAESAIQMLGSSNKSWFFGNENSFVILHS
jgi:hypothetical protein